MSNRITFESFGFISEHESFKAWQYEQYTEVDDYTIQKRKERLLSIVKRVIENELDEQDKKIVKLYFYERYNQTQIAIMLERNNAYVCRHLHKSINIIRQNLKYLIEYCYGFEF